jgi:hypothetical protein
MNTMLRGIKDQFSIRWATLRRFVFAPPKLVATYSDGARVPLGFFTLWGPIDRIPHVLVKVECDGIIVWRRW